MPTEQQIRSATQAMMGSIPAPALSFAVITAKMQQRERNAHTAHAPDRRRAIATALALIAIPASAFAVVSYETRQRAALHENGGSAPPPAPPALIAQLQPHKTTLAGARSSLRFALVAPAGLPGGTSLPRISVASVGIYDANSGAWRAGESEARFSYQRVGGRSFTLIARRYDESLLPGRYLFVDAGPDAHGNPVLQKHERFAWRAGNQLTIAESGESLTAAEIASVAHAMNGTMLELPWPSPQGRGILEVLGQ